MQSFNDQAATPSQCADLPAGEIASASSTPARLFNANDGEKAMTTLTHDRTTIPSQRETTSHLTFDKHFAVFLGVLIVTVLLVIASTFAGPPVVNMDLMPIGP